MTYSTRLPTAFLTHLHPGRSSSFCSTPLPTGSAASRAVSPARTFRTATSSSILHSPHPSSKSPAKAIDLVQATPLHPPPVPPSHPTTRTHQGVSSDSGNVTASCTGTGTGTGSSSVPKVEHLPSTNSTRLTWTQLGMGGEGRGESTVFHDIFLRDHCRCPSCFHPVTKQRLLDTFSIPREIAPKNLETTPEGLRITWNDPTSHETYLPYTWLRQHSYDPPLPPNTTTTSPSTTSTPPKERRKILWDSSISKAVPTVSYGDIVSEDEEVAERGVWEWLGLIDVYGFCFVKGIPPTPEATESLIRRIAFIRETHYGGFWDFTSNLAHGDTAYTDIALGAHTDTTYFTDVSRLPPSSSLASSEEKGGCTDVFLSHTPPTGSISLLRPPLGIGIGLGQPCGLQLFHLLSPRSSHSGGHNLLVDGFKAASILSRDHPKSYATLSTLNVPTKAEGGDGVDVRQLWKEGSPIFEHGPVLFLRSDSDPGPDHSRSVSSPDVEGGGPGLPSFGGRPLRRVRWNNDDRDVVAGPGSGWRAEDVGRFYDAIRDWEGVVRSDECRLWTEMEMGTAIIFDNLRVLHGRSSFTGERRLCGAYVNGDDWRSRLRVLDKRFSAF